MRSRDDIIKMLRNLQNKANDKATTSEEKEMFLINISQLMKIYKIEASDIEDITVETYTIVFKVPTKLHWAKDLVGHLAILFGCTSVVIYEGPEERGIRTGMVILGQKLFVELATLAAEHYYKIASAAIENFFNRRPLPLKMWFMTNTQREFIEESFGKGFIQATLDALVFDINSHIESSTSEPLFKDVVELDMEIFEDAPTLTAANEISSEEISTENSDNGNLVNLVNSEHNLVISDRVEEFVKDEYADNFEEDIIIKIDGAIYQQGYKSFSIDHLRKDITQRYRDLTKNRKQRRREKATSRKQRKNV